MYLYFSIGNGQPREPALCQLYRHTFVPYESFLSADSQCRLQFCTASSTRRWGGPFLHVPHVAWSAHGWTDEQIEIKHGTGSFGHRFNGSFGSSFTSGSPGHNFDPVWGGLRPEFFSILEKMPKMQNVQLSLKYWHLINILQNFTFQKRANAKQR